MLQASSQTFGRYKVVGPLGTGGMAQVFQGYDPVLDRQVAIKVVSRGKYDSAFNERFRREARAIAALRHPNIIHVYDYGEHDGSHYMVMELVCGTDLGHHFLSLRSQQKQMGPPEVQSIMDQVAAGLDYAHARHIIHRDVKPSNILLGDDGTVVLTDFGLMLRVDPGVEPTQGQSVGTPEYVAPEQVMDGAFATRRSDVYSLGVVLYLMLTGSLPFQSEMPIQTALKHLHEEPPSPRQFNPALSPDVEAVILKAIAKEPKERYASAGEMARALRAAWRDELSDASMDLTQGASPVVAHWLTAALPRRMSLAAVSRRLMAALPRRVSPAAVAHRLMAALPRRVSSTRVAGGIALVVVIVGLVAVFARGAGSRLLLGPVPSATPSLTATLAPVPSSTSAPTLMPTVTPIASATATPTVTPAASATVTPTLVVTATRIPSTPRPGTGPLKLAYEVTKQCVSGSPGSWSVRIKMQAQGGNGIYTYYLDGKGVSKPLMGEYIHMLQVSGGSVYKVVKLNVESAGVLLKTPVELEIKAPDGC